MVFLVPDLVHLLSPIISPMVIIFICIIIQEVIMVAGHLVIINIDHGVMQAINHGLIVQGLAIHGNHGLAILQLGLNLFQSVKSVPERVIQQLLVCTGMIMVSLHRNVKFVENGVTLLSIADIGIIMHIKAINLHLLYLPTMLIKVFMLMSLLLSCKCSPFHYHLLHRVQLIHMFHKGQILSLFHKDKATRTILHHGKSSNNELFKVHVHIFPTLLNKGAISSLAFLGHAVKSSLWHQRCGHPSNDILAAMLWNSNISCNSDVTSKVCSHCISGKMSRLPFTDRVDRVVIPFHKIHSDVWGPSPVVSLQGFRYYVSFINEATRFVWIFSLMNKSGVF
ncbi:uncharacterized protein LOC126603501 isoform X1 [Malus sylvestris]|uniref:uncharacterized protein LOC126603501 isoform X1 n=1 Tax=Malus sylvestris TaxID=3752 RepID=UPI0021ACA32B|nr:uncharacterized protein LOC126603501 isoform X1 [Malus sylvestris]